MDEKLALNSNLETSWARRFPEDRSVRGLGGQQFALKGMRRSPLVFAPFKFYGI